MRVALYRTLEQFERVLKPVSFPSRDVRECTQIHIVSGEVAGRTFTGPANFSSLQVGSMTLDAERHMS